MVVASVIGLNHLPTQMMSLWDWACSQTWTALDCTLGHLGSWLPPSAFLETKEENTSVNCVPLVQAPRTLNSIQLKISSQMMSDLGRNYILSITCGWLSILDFYFCLSLIFPRNILSSSGSSKSTQPVPSTSA